MDYQTQQMKLIPIMAIMFAHSITGDTIISKYKQMMEDIKKQNFKGLDVLHHFCSGMKNVYTQDTTDSL